MTTRTIEIEDNLKEIIDSAISDLKDMANDYLDGNSDLEEAPDLYDDLNSNEDFYDLVDMAVPIYTSEINDLFYLYGNKFEEAFDNAGIGEKNNDGWPMGWYPAAIYCYIEQELSDWYEEHKDEIFNEWKEKQENKEDK